MNTAILGALVAHPSVLVGKLFAEALPGAAIAYAIVWWAMRPKDGRKVAHPFLSHAGGVFASVTGAAIFRIIAMATFAGRSAFEPAADTGAAGFYTLLVPAVVAAGYIAWLKSHLANQLKLRTTSNSGNDAYAAALAEIEEGRLDKGVWARSFADSGGDESKAKAAYIKARAESLKGAAVWANTQPPAQDVPAVGVSPPPAGAPPSPLWWLAGIAVVGIVAAMALPAYQDYSKRPAVPARPVQPPPVDSMGWTQETTNSTEIGPWLDYAPAGTRYYRDAKGTIYQLYPPGIKPNAEPANPFGFSSSTLTAAELSAQGQAPAPQVSELKPFSGKLDDYQDAVSAIEAKDYTRAANILKFLAAEGNSDAQWRLAVMYQNGQGVPQDYKEAVKWNRLAAAQGNAFVHYNLAQMYESGQGTPQNFVQAHKWFSLAATSNVPSSAQRRDTLEQSMSPQQIAQAQQMARDCQQRNFKGCD